ncbi:hypothetical protein [Pseudochryseolinea flava]|uniref:Uncharacterized protein n=1 Tax=Pseudochryseolinea flava TaxID=2059302 RepID=A0A364XVY1_9BACT|nr:hypothetical protein [Pseudochryseolinea flava]RAV98283.1 hypothetical protein DQQ10_24345 [Pseudochryseolinea flava]
MKNMPEKDFWNSIKTRLGNYEEVPADDAWHKIAGALPPAVSNRGKLKKGIGTATVFILGALAGAGVTQFFSHHDQRNVTSEQEIAGRGPNNSTRNDERRLKDEIATNGHRDTSSLQVSDSDRSTTTTTTSGYPLINDPGKSGGLETTVVEQHSIANLARSSDGTHPPSLSAEQIKRRKNSDVVHSAEDNGTVHAEQSAIATADTNPVIAMNDNNSISDSASAVHDTVGNAHVPSVSANLRRRMSAKPRGDESMDSTDTSVKESEQRAVTKTKQKEDLRKPKILRNANVYAVITPSLSFQEITPVKTDGIEVLDFESPGVIDNARLGWSFDAGYQGVIKKNLEWYAGLSYYQQQQTLSYRYNTGKFDVTQTPKGITMTPQTATKSFSYNMRNVGASAGVFYTIKQGGLRHKFGAGLQFHQGLLKSSGESSYNNKQSRYLNYQLSYRLEMSANQRWNIFLQPSYTHAIISNENLREPFKLKPYRAGIGVGAIYRF